MHTLNHDQCQAITGGDFKPWQTVTISGASSAILFGLVQSIDKGPVAGLMYAAAGGLITAATSGLIVGGIALFEHFNQTDPQD